MIRIPIAVPMPIPALAPDVKVEVDECAEGDDGERVLARVVVGVVTDADDVVGEVGEGVGESEMIAGFVDGVVE